MTSEWDDACDPVPARREMTPETRATIREIFRKRKKAFLDKDSVPTAYVDSDFEDMGA